MVVLSIQPVLVGIGAAANSSSSADSTAIEEPQRGSRILQVDTLPIEPVSSWQVGRDIPATSSRAV